MNKTVYRVPYRSPYFSSYTTTWAPKNYTPKKREKSRLHFQFHQKAWVKAIATTTSKKNQISIVLFGDFFGGLYQREWVV
jgi:hypothetical protein